MSKRQLTIGSNFEYRCRDFATKIGYINTKRQPSSGATSYAEDKGDLLASLQISKDDILPFLFESKKTMNKTKLTFDYEWLIGIRKKSKRMMPKRIPGVLFSGKNMPIFIMIDCTTYYSLFGNYKTVSIKELHVKGKRYFRIRWAVIVPMLKGQIKEDRFLKCIKISEFECMILKFEDFTKHLELALKMSCGL